MTIKQQGGVFGRNPTFNDVTIEGQLTFDGDIDINSDLKVSGDIETTGNVIIGTSGKGIDFSATAGTGTSELLNDYEEGTWTVTGSGGLTFTGSPTYTGLYTKIGRMVYVNLRIQATSISSASGFINGGFPFVSANYYTTVPIVNTSNNADLGLGIIGFSGGSTIIYLPTFSSVTDVTFTGFYYV